jgi:hypothetical protein
MQTITFWLSGPPRRNRGFHAGATRAQCCRKQQARQLRAPRPIGTRGAGGWGGDPKPTDPPAPSTAANRDTLCWRLGRGTLNLQTRQLRHPAANRDTLGGRLGRGTLNLQTRQLRAQRPIGTRCAGDWGGLMLANILGQHFGPTFWANIFGQHFWPTFLGPVFLLRLGPTGGSRAPEGPEKNRRALRLGAKKIDERSAVLGP